MRKTKIICTLGPACDDENILRTMMQNGLDCARLNFSHGTHEEQKVRMERVKRLRNELNIPLPILLDTKGPEIRVRLFKDGKVELKTGNEFRFCSDYDLIGDETKVGLTYPDLALYVNKPGIIILADDGKTIKIDMKGNGIFSGFVLPSYDQARKNITKPEDMKTIAITALCAEKGTYKGEYLFGNKIK